MKNYTITVNGSVYDVVVEEGATRQLRLRQQHPQQAARQAALRSRLARQAKCSRLKQT